MTRASKRKSDHQNSEPVKNKRVDSVRSVLYGIGCKFCVLGFALRCSWILALGLIKRELGPDASNRAATKVDERIDQLYNKYANKSSSTIDPEGIEALCSDLKVDYTDVRILMLAWKMNAQKQGYFTLDEWRRGLKTLKVDTITKLKKILPELETEALKPENFDNFYKYSFHYCLTEEKQKCLDIETSCILLELVLGSQFPLQVESFIKFLKIQSEYKAINMDQWTNFLRFCQEIHFPELENYDTGEAWALLIDNFVEWMNQK